MRDGQGVDELWETLDVNKRGWLSPADLKQGLRNVGHRNIYLSYLAHGSRAGADVLTSAAVRRWPHARGLPCHGYRP